MLKSRNKEIKRKEDAIKWKTEEDENEYRRRKIEMENRRKSTLRSS